MACSHPYRIFPTGRTTENGKPEYFFTRNADSFISVQDLEKRYPDGKWIHPLTAWAEVPCGHCLGCRQDYANRWAFRVMCESLEYEEGQVWFFTLTYDDLHLPEDMAPRKEDLSKFIKGLRNYFRGEVKIRFFGCGEKGENTQRPHIHVILFGFDFSRWTCKVKYDKTQWTFPFIEDLWGKGFCPGSPVFDSAAAGNYTAKYQLKDFGRDGCWIQGSLKPGIGLRYIENLTVDMDFEDPQPLIVGNGKGKVIRSGIPKALRQRLGLPSQIGSLAGYKKLFGEMVAAGYTKEEALRFACIEFYRETKEFYSSKREVFSKLSRK